MRKVCVCNLKGGTGKSLVTANLAATLASSGKKVLVVDRNQGVPTQHFVFGTRPGVQGVNENLRIVSGFTQEDFNSVWPEADILLSDTSPGVLDTVVSESETVFLIATPDPLDLLGAFRTARQINKLGTKAKMSLVVNQAIGLSQARQAHERAAQSFAKFLNCQLGDLLWIPLSPQLAKSWSRQTVLTMGQVNPTLKAHFEEMAHVALECHPSPSIGAEGFLQLAESHKTAA